MGFYFRDPQTFPAIFPEAVRASTSNPDQWITVYRTDSPSDAAAKLQLFKWYRWCIKQKPEIYPDLANRLASFKLRGRIEQVPDCQIYYFHCRAQPIFPDCLLPLNPHLADTLRPYCQ